MHTSSPSSSSSSPSPILNPTQLISDRNQLLQLIQSHRFSPLPNLRDLLIQSSPSILSCPPDQIHPLDPLDHLIRSDQDPIPYFLILSSRLQHFRSTSFDPSKTLSQAHQFCNTIDPNQLLLLAPHLSSDLHSFAQHLIRCSSHLNQLRSSIDPLFKLIKSTGPINILTSPHHELLKISLQCRSIDSAVELTNLDIDIDQEKYPIRYQDHLIYHYLAGIVQALNHNYPRAIHLLTIAVSAPGLAVSQIQLEAYKKLILISLLLTSSPPVLPPYTNPYLKSTFKLVNHNKLYLEFMSLYESAESIDDGYGQLIAMVEKNVSSFRKDNNLGLVKLCIESLPKKAIQKLVPIYTSIPIQFLDLALKNLAGVDAGSLVRSMIESGELKARFDPKTDVVNFHEHDDDDDEDALVGPAGGHQKTHDVLREIVQRVQAIELDIKRTSAEIERNKEFLKRLIQDVKLSSNDKLPSSTNEFLQATVPGGIDSLAHDQNLSGMMIEEDLAVDVGMAWED